MERMSFWREVFTLQGSVTVFILPRVFLFGIPAVLTWLIWEWSHLEIHLAVAPYEVAGAVLGLLLVLRTNAGYERWWEARKLWGGIVNQCRNLAAIAVAYGPDDPKWRSQLVRWTAAFPHVSRYSLRGERSLPEVKDLLGEAAAEEVAEADHMPSHVAMKIAQLLRHAVEKGTLDRFAFIQAEKERATLIDHIGACERILKTPLPRAYSIKIRRFLFLFLLTLPFALLDKVGWLTPLVAMLVSYPLLSLDQIGCELENPFSARRLCHLPLGDISKTIERNLLSFIEYAPDTIDQPINGKTRTQEQELVGVHANGSRPDGIPSFDGEV